MRNLFLLAALALALPATADLQLNYNGFYGRMKKLQQPQYSDITLAFALTGVHSGKACRFYSLKLLSDQHDIAVDIAGNGELSLPYDEALKDSNAVLLLRQADNAEACQVEMRLRSRMRLPSSLDLATLQHYQQQFDLLLDDMAGISKYWLPAVSGVIAEFNTDTVVAYIKEAAGDSTSCKAKRCYIKLSDATPANSRWSFNERPAYLLPLIESNTE